MQMLRQIRQGDLSCCGGDVKIQGEACHYCQCDGKTECRACDGTGTVED